MYNSFAANGHEENADLFNAGITGDIETEVTKSRTNWELKARMQN